MSSRLPQYRHGSDALKSDLGRDCVRRLPVASSQGLFLLCATAGTRNYQRLFQGQRIRADCHVTVLTF
jgi:hypothetical protein